MMDIRNDFDYELSVGSFPFRDLFLNTVAGEVNPFRENLFKEFEALEPQPKVNIYLRTFIPDEEWSKVDNGGNENYARELVQAFEEMQVKGQVKPEYYGRFIGDTATVKTLTRANVDLELLRVYVISNGDKDARAFAISCAKSICRTLDELADLKLKQKVIKTILAEKTSIPAMIESIYGDKGNGVDFQNQYAILKTFADDVFGEALAIVNSLSQLDQVEKSSTSGLTLKDLFVDPHKYHDIIKIFKDAGYIVEANSRLTWTPSRSNSKYEPISLLKALDMHFLIDIKTLTQPVLKEVLVNTFYGYEPAKNGFKDAATDDKAGTFFNLIKSRLS